MGVRGFLRTAALVVGAVCLVPLVSYHHERRTVAGGYSEHTGLGPHPYDWLSFDRQQAETTQTLPDGRTATETTYQHSNMVNYLSVPMYGVVVALLLFGVAARLRPRPTAPPPA